MVTSITNSLASVIPPWGITLIVIGAIACLGIGFAVGLFSYRRYRNNQVGTTKQQATQILEFAKDEAKELKAEALKEAREEAQKQKNEFDRQVRERNGELAKQENRLNQKEEALDKKERT